MKRIIAKIDFTLKGKTYKKGKEVNINDFNILLTLNERGFIEPLSIKEINEIIKKESEDK